MAVALPSVAAPQAPASTAVRELAFDERWAAWQAKGVAHERAVRRRMAIAAPILIIVAALAYVVLAG